MQRLAGGLEQLQYLSAIILYIIAHDTRAAEVASSKLQSLDLTLDHVKDILDDWIESIASDDEILADGSTGTEPTQAQVLHARALKIKVLLETWLPSWPGV